ncbi:PREDICTED: Kv channel-interacting protein 1-like [Vollenhovia emeryi]|uniref:Kv channel-interacting protein 1-like n=1 Tax=Vollenhovia emeryi TaxID=411798 RepID=UPI0005F5209E|nr:PREDICTED: Kv channel-interacting protein 1-like [Vollenhovia emeryi]
MIYDTILLFRFAISYPENTKISYGINKLLSMQLVLSTISHLCDLLARPMLFCALLMEKRVTGVSPVHIFKPQNSIARPNKWSPAKLYVYMVYRVSLNLALIKLAELSTIIFHDLFSLSFFQECPEGVVHEDSFKDIYAKFFPHGNSSLYAHYVFKAFDVNCNGAISFRDLLVTLSTLLRGSIYEKLRWTFKLYDINGDGCITRGELGEVVTAVHELMGRRHHQAEEDRKAREQLDRVFKKLDLNQDGVITIEEFIESCLKDDVITRSLAMFDCAL